MQLSETNRAEYYANAYRNQGGGANFPVFQGSRYSQYGHGFGDILRGIVRFALPVVARGAWSFVEGLMKNRSEGQDWKTAAKGAIAPTAMATLSEVGNQMEQHQQSRQVGHGRKRKHPIMIRRETLYKAKRKRPKKTKISKLEARIKKNISHSLPEYNF